MQEKLNFTDTRSCCIIAVSYTHLDVYKRQQPTRGVDIGAIEYIHDRLLKLRDEGKAILLISADLDEVKNLSDRLMVMYDGEIVAEGEPADFDDMQLGLLMTGAVGKGGQRA